MRVRAGVLSLLVILWLTGQGIAGIEERYVRADANKGILTNLFGQKGFGKSYALIIGVGDYLSYNKLTAPAADAERVRNFLRDEAKFDEIVTLTDEKVTRSEIENLMERYFPQRVQSNDRFLFYFSGHGITRNLRASKRGYLVLRSSHKNAWDEMIDMPRVREWVENLGNARHVLFIIDACFSGLSAVEFKGDSDVKDRTVERLMQPASHIVTAGVEGEESFIVNGESLFTKGLLAAARGTMSPPKDGIISISEVLIQVNRFIDSERALLNDKIKMTPHLFLSRAENNAGEFFFLPAVNSIALQQASAPSQTASTETKGNQSAPRGRSRRADNQAKGPQAPASGPPLAQPAVPPPVQVQPNEPTFRFLNLFGDIFERVRVDYVVPPDNEKLLSDAIDGMQAAFPGAQGFSIAGKTALQQNSTAVGERARSLGLLKAFGDTFARILADRTSYPFALRDFVGPELAVAAINGMVNGLDPYSSYIDAKSFSRDYSYDGATWSRTRDEFGGLGIEVTKEDGLVKVVAPIDDTAGAKAGLRAGDIITHLDDEAVQGLTLNQAVEKMRGPVNSKIRLKVMRKGLDKPLDIAIVRDTITVRSVRSRTDGDDVGYVRITQFNEYTTDGLKKSIADISNQLGSDKVKGYVIDLRNNPGGLLDQAISVSDAFLERGEIVSTRGRDPEETQRFNARPGDLTKGKPVILLINGGSASASEIVAGALQDHRRATLVGTRSFGGGSVQSIIPLGSGNGALRLTTARYFTPSGRSIQGNGIAPDIEVVEGGPFPNDKALNLALDLMRGIRTNPAFPPNPKSAILPN
jgi:carboxyl-terminal processing protease